MREGKVPENVLKRSILKKTGVKREEILSVASVGSDAAKLLVGGNSLTLVSVAACHDSNVDFTIISATNNILAAGGRPVGIELALSLPLTSTEEDIKSIMTLVNNTCKDLNLQLLGGHSELTKAVVSPVISVTAIGTAAETSEFRARPGDDVVVTKWIGLEGTARIVRAREQELLGKFPSKMIYDAGNFSKILSVAPEAAPAAKSGVTAMHDISGGGIFAALWELAEGSGVGLEIELKKIPVKQETIEICNYFDINPYELLSGGSMLMTSGDGNRLVLDLQQAGVNAAVIGKITDSNDRVVINGDIRRFLEPSRNDEIHKAIAE